MAKKAKKAKKAKAKKAKKSKKKSILARVESLKLRPGSQLRV